METRLPPDEDVFNIWWPELRTRLDTNVRGLI
jgi:hypothetical protein